jgi:hypothetical protein
LREHRSSSSSSPLLRARFPASLGGSLVDPRLRASNEHVIASPPLRAWQRAEQLRRRSGAQSRLSQEGKRKLTESAREFLKASAWLSPIGSLREVRTRPPSARPSSFLRVPPRIPCRFRSPRIAHASPLSSEPLNFPHGSLISNAPPHRHSGCSSTHSSADGTNGWKGGDAEPRPLSNVEC